MCVCVCVCVCACVRACILNGAIEFFLCRILYELRFNIVEIYENVQLETLNKLSLVIDLVKIYELNRRQLEDSTHSNLICISCTFSTA